MLIALILVAMLAGVAAAQTYTDVTVEEAKVIIETCCGRVILDVRTPEEYAAGYIPGARNIPLAELGGRLDELDPDAATVVYCKAGSRSATASQLLVDNGFAEVYNMLGGYDAWVAAGYPTTTGEGGCFIATAAYGSAMEVHVGTLRDFRDAYLRTDPLGSGFVSLYYSASPPIAGLIDDHPALKPVVRGGLLPAVAVSELALGMNFAQKMAMAGTAAFSFAAIGLLLRRRLGRNRPAVRGV